MIGDRSREPDRERELHRLLELAAERVDLEQLAGVDQRYLASFRHEAVEPPPSW